MEAKEVAQDIFWLFFFSRFCDWIEWMGIVCVSSESDPFAPSAQTSNQRWGYYANLISAEGCHNIEIRLPEKPRPRQTFSFSFDTRAAPLREKVCKSIIQMGKVSPLMEKPPITSIHWVFLLLFIWIVTQGFFIVLLFGAFPVSRNIAWFCETLILWKRWKRVHMVHIWWCKILL